jgi:hypothetical protein
MTLKNWRYAITCCRPNYITTISYHNKSACFKTGYQIGYVVEGAALLLFYLQLNQIAKGNKKKIKITLDVAFSFRCCCLDATKMRQSV